ncbi:MAG: YihY/virulence factor BrkB family protein [Myxococcales bacterium]|nr:MAG: YihY/virulence factor BrkB family protein [Myxococcales bacterium]
MSWFRERWTWLKRILRFAGRVIGSFMKNRGVLLAGGVGYNALLSLVPFLTLTVAILSLFLDKARILSILSRELKMLVPQHADTILQTVETFLQSPAAISAVSVIVLLFFSSIAFRMLDEAVAAIFQTSGNGLPRRAWISALLPFALMLLLMVALLSLTLLTSILDALGDSSVKIFGGEISLAPGIKLLLRLAGFLGLVLLFAGIYRVLPVVKISLRRAFIGGLCATILWRLVGIVMVYYFTTISTVNLIYGSLATVIVLLLFLEIGFIILLFGAQVIAELEASSAAGLPWYEKPGPT